MLPIQDELRVLLKAEYPDGPKLLALVNSVVSTAKIDFVISRLHMHDIYETRLGLSREVTNEWYEGLKETVDALGSSKLEMVRFLEIEFEEGDCIIFADEAIQEILGVIYFRERKNNNLSG